MWGQAPTKGAALIIAMQKLLTCCSGHHPVQWLPWKLSFHSFLSMCIPVPVSGNCGKFFFSPNFFSSFTFTLYKNKQMIIFTSRGCQGYLTHKGHPMDPSQERATFSPWECVCINGPLCCNTHSITLQTDRNIFLHLQKLVWWGTPVPKRFTIISSASSHVQVNILIVIH